MKIATLFIPAYLPRAYAGATPTPYQSGTVDKFERQLADLSPVVIRQPNATRLLPDTSGRFAHPEIVTPYQVVVSPDEPALGDAIILALKTFGLESFTVTLSDIEGAPVSTADAEALAAGIHPWNEEA